MPLDFPNSPTTGQIYTENGNSWKYNGSVWLALSNSSDFTASSTAPLTPKTGDMWFDTDNGKLYIYYDSYWVNPAVVGGGALTASASTITGTNSEGSATTYAKSDHNHAYGSKSIPQSALALGPTYETSLPASPVDGQEIYYQADSSNNIIWHLRYRAAGGTYKWEYLGGPRLFKEFGSADATPYPTSYADVVSPANTLSVPLAGKYMVSLSAGAFVNSGVSLARIRISYKIGNTAASASDEIECDVSRASLVANDSRDKVKTFTSATTLTLQYYCVESNISAFVLGGHTLSLTPIAVG